MIFFCIQQLPQVTIGQNTRPHLVPKIDPLWLQLRYPKYIPEQKTLLYQEGFLEELNQTHPLHQ